MKFWRKIEKNFLQNFATSKKSTSLDEKNDSIKPHMWGWGVKFLKKRPCGALFLPTCTTPPPVIIFFRRGLDRNFRQVKKFCIPIYQKCTFFTKKKNRPCIIGVDIEEGKWGFSGFCGVYPLWEAGWRPFFGSKFSLKFFGIFRVFFHEKVGKKWSWGGLENGAKIRGKNDPKNGVKFHEIFS